MKQSNVKKSIKTSLPDWARCAMIALAILQIIFGIICCATSKIISDALVTNFKESMQEATVTYDDEEMQKTADEITAKIENIFEYSWIFFILNGVIICASNTFILIWSIKKTLLINKPKAVALCAISLAFSSTAYNTFFSIVSLIIMIAVKRKIPEDFGDKNKKLKIEFNSQSAIEGEIVKSETKTAKKVKKK